MAQVVKVLLQLHLDDGRVISVDVSERVGYWATAFEVLPTASPAPAALAPEPLRSEALPAAAAPTPATAAAPTRTAAPAAPGASTAGSRPSAPPAAPARSPKSAAGTR